MRQIFLDFEQPIADLESKIEELRLVQSDSAVDISEEIARLKKVSVAWVVRDAAERYIAEQSLRHAK